MQSQSPVNSQRAQLAEYLRGRRPGQPAQFPRIPRNSDAGPAPLSDGQRLIWLHSQGLPDTPLYNEAWTVHFAGEMHVPALKQALTEFIRRHEAWRTTFGFVRGEPAQFVQPDPVFEFDWTDLRSLPAEQRELRAARLGQADAQRPFDLSAGPLVRVRLVTFENDLHRLYLTLHHIIFDGFSIYRVFLPELAELYDGFAAGRPPSLPEVPLQYRQYSRWQHDRWRAGEVSEDMRYWLDHLAGDTPTLNLPSHRGTSRAASVAGAMCRVWIPRELRDALKEIGAREGATLFMVLLAAFEALLYRYAGQVDFLVGTVTSGRNHPDLQNLVGYCLHNVALRADLSGSPSFRQVLHRVRNETLQALAHDDAPFDLLVRELRPKRYAGGTPLFNVMFSLEPPIARVNPRWNLTQVEVENSASKFDLDFELDERADGLVGKLVYRTALFSREMAERYVADYLCLLRAVATAPDLGVDAMTFPAGTVAQTPPAAEFGGQLGRTSGPEPDPATINRLLPLWGSVLGTGAIGLHDDFFDLGGHSFSAVKLISLVRSEFGASISLAEFQQCPTIAGLAVRLHATLAAAAQKHGAQEGVHL